MDDEGLLRRYLTGSLADEEAEELDLWLLVDDDLFALAEEIEQEVLADFAQGRLTPAEAESVRHRFAASPQGRGRLALAEGLTLLPEHLRICEQPEAGTRLNDLERCEALLARSRDLRLQDPAERMRLARLAADVASALDRRRHGTPEVLDLRCRAQIELADAYRMAGRPLEAEGCLCRAAGLLPPGLRGRPLRARLLAVKASLHAVLRPAEDHGRR